MSNSTKLTETVDTKIDATQSSTPALVTQDGDTYAKSVLKGSSPARFWSATIQCSPIEPAPKSACGFALKLGPWPTSASSWNSWIR